MSERKSLVSMGDLNEDGIKLEEEMQKLLYPVILRCLNEGYNMTHVIDIINSSLRKDSILSLITTERDSK